MLTIQRDGNGYRVAPKGDGSRWKVKAQDIGEAKLAVEHYFEGHQNGGVRLPACPVCRTLKA